MSAPSHSTLPFSHSFILPRHPNRLKNTTDMKVLLIALLVVCHLSGVESQSKSVLRSHNLAALEISKSSDEQFRRYMTSLCVYSFASVEDYTRKYLLWENANFLNGIEQFLSEDGEDDFPHQYVAQGLVSQCKVNKAKDAHHQKIIDDGEEENELYNQMTKPAWSPLEL
ncbi:unnamed protein product [Caenorhabditis sp. 36 PRJEB53466]|nr:unnamed protein product [Caenorhabditis sp. 36 PRJEB53466]